MEVLFKISNNELVLRYFNKRNCEELLDYYVQRKVLRIHTGEHAHITSKGGPAGGAGKPHSQPELLCKLTAQSAAGSRSQPGHQGCVQPAVAVRMQMTSSLSQKKGQSELLRAFPEETLQTLSRGRTVN